MKNTGSPYIFLATLKLVILLNLLSSSRILRQCDAAKYMSMRSRWDHDYVSFFPANSPSI